MKAIVAARGWPGRSLIGDDGAQAAWLLVQHADHDPAFQRVCLELLGHAARSGWSRPLGSRLVGETHRKQD